MIDVKAKLFSAQDKKYRDFQAKLLPTVQKEKIVGVRTPVLKKIAKEIFKAGESEDFLHTIPHEFFEENQIHAFLICEIKDFEKAIFETENFLPFIDNWATCDQLLPSVFKKNKKDLLVKIKNWISSNQTYTIRFGIGMLMKHFLDDDFSIEYAKIVSEIRSNEYYVNMMIAWYFATALSKHSDEILPFIKGNRLSTWVLNKTIQKSCESKRISAEIKIELKSWTILRRSIQLNSK